MRVLLFNAKTGSYWSNEEGWIDQSSLARNFGTSLKAALYAQEHQIEHSEVYLDFGDTDWDVRLPVLGRTARPDPDKTAAPTS